MEFRIETPKTGKPCIIMDGYKFRQDKKLTSGNFTWRCLGKDCTAYLHTNDDWSSILMRKNQHKGKHPVTMRSLAPPSPRAASPLTPAAVSPPPPSSLTPASARLGGPSIPYTSSPNSPLLSQVVIKKLNVNKASQTDNLSLESKDKLVARIEQLLQQRDTLITKVQELTIDIEKAVNEKVNITMIEERLNQLKKENSHLKNKILELEQQARKNNDDIICKQETIVCLNDNINCLNLKINVIENDKLDLNDKIRELHKILDSKTMEHSNNNNYVQKEPIPTSNRFSVLQEGGTSEATAKGIKKRKKRKSKIRQDCITVSLYSDSHGRGMNTLLMDEFPSKNTLIKPSVVKPGAPQREVIRDIEGKCHRMNAKDYVICIAGTNDVGRFKFQKERFVNDYRKLAKSSPNCRFLLSTVPLRYDQRFNSRVNIKIRELNEKLLELPNEFNNVRLLHLELKKRHLFKGIHFHLGGKKDVCRDIYNIIEDWTQNKHVKTVMLTTNATNQQLSSFGPSHVLSEEASSSTLPPIILSSAVPSPYVPSSALPSPVVMSPSVPSAALPSAAITSPAVMSPSVIPTAAMSSAAMSSTAVSSAAMSSAAMSSACAPPVPLLYSLVDFPTLPEQNPTSLNSKPGTKMIVA